MSEELGCNRCAECDGLARMRTSNRPFAITAPWAIRHWLTCVDCGRSGPQDMFPDKALAAWNSENQKKED